MNDIIDFMVGLKIAVRSGNDSRYGEIIKVTASTVEVLFDDKSTQKFSRSTRRLIGWKDTKYKQPYLCTVAVARAKDAEYAAATERARANLKAKGII